VWRRYGDVARIGFGPFEYLLVNDAPSLHHVLVENARNYVKSRTYRAFRPLLGDGLLTSEGDFWRRQRRLIQPAFHRERLVGFVDAMTAETEESLSRWRSREGGAAPLDIGREMNQLTFRVVGRTLFGVDLESNPKLSEATRVALRFIDTYATSMVPLPTWVPTPGNRRFARALAVLDGLVADVLSRPPGGGGDVLSLLRAARDEDTGEAMSPRQLRDEVMTLMLAGHETTANALTWAFYLLAQHPAAVDALRAELRSVLDGRAPRFEDLAKLDYTRAVIQEAMRLYPPVWKVERTALARDEIAGYTVEPGTIIGMTMHTLHRHPAAFDDAERFDPERFLPGNAKAKERHRFAYLPFGAGPRQCIGNTFALVEAQAILATIVQRCQLILLPDPPVEIDTAVTIHPRGVVPMIARFS
jgi:cytochrome P450